MSYAKGVKADTIQALSSRIVDGTGFKVGIVYAKWNKAIVQALLEGCTNELLKQGVLKKDIYIYEAPGLI